MPSHSLNIERPLQGTESGIIRIQKAFLRAEQDKLAALMPYFTLGYPEASTSLAIIREIASYSDLLELGMPFSDPIADGPTIQRSTQQVLAAGLGTSECLQMLSDLRHHGVDTPALLMGYYNPILSYGERRFVRDAKSAGADGLIIPDLPPEESMALARECNQSGLALVQFLAPNSSSERIRVAISAASGFVYIVSVTGVTGARTSLPASLGEFVDRVREIAKLPVVVGFGISSASQVATVGSYADGVIIGSALINAVDEADDKIRVAREFIGELGRALQAR